MARKKEGLSAAEASAEAERYAGKVSGETVAEMVRDEDRIKGFFRYVGVLRKHWADACEVFALLRDWTAGRYRETPWGVIAALAGALLYVLSPLDVVPDFIPVVGYTDDAAVFAAVLSFARPDLEKYRAWKKSRDEYVGWKDLDGEP